MPITDATTSLATTWTEHAVVSFTAGTLATSAEMITEIESKLKRGTLGANSSPTSTSVNRWLVRAKEELMQVKSFDFSRRYAYATLTAGDYRVSLPPDYAGGSIRLNDQTNDYRLVPWPSHIFDSKFPDVDAESNGAPRVFTIKHMELWLAPPVNASTILELEYDRSSDDNTTTDFAYLPEVERFRCCDYALYEACESLEDWEKAKWYWDKWARGLGRSVGADARKKWKNMGFRAISIFENAALRSHQS